MRPSAAASATTRVSSETARIASSLPGMGKSTRSGSQLVSRMATTGMPSLRASSTARRSLLVSTIHTAEGLGELVLFAAQYEKFLLRQAGGCYVFEVDFFEFLQTLQALVNGREVGQHSAQPALVYVGHAHARGLFSDRFLRLLLGSDEQNVSAMGHGLLHELVSAVDMSQGLLQVNDVDTVAFGEDETLHLRVPATSLVSEVDTAVEELSHSDDGHD